MNWYKLFYFVSVADGIRTTLIVLGVCSSILAVVGICIYTLANQFDAPKGVVDSTKAKSAKVLRWLIPVSVLLLLLSSLVPSKQDALMIIAGGAVGTYITGDSSIKALPREATELLREKIRAEVKEIRSVGIIDTLKDKSKEELIELIKEKTK